MRAKYMGMYVCVDKWGEADGIRIYSIRSYEGGVRGVYVGCFARSFDDDCD